MEGERRAGADRRLPMMKSCVRYASADPLMKGKQQPPFPSLALISPLSGGSVVNALRRRLDGGRHAADGKDEGVEEENKRGWWGVGSYLSFVVDNACMYR